MARFSYLLACLVVTAVPAAAQSPFYAGVNIATERGTPGTFDVRSFPTLGGFVGVRVHDAWSFELHVDRGFGESAERPRNDIFGESVVVDRPGWLRAVLVTWAPLRGGRVGLAVTAGISGRALSTERVSITHPRPDAPFPPELGPVTKDGSGGWTAGLVVPITLGDAWSIAPEIRGNFGFTGEHGLYTTASAGVRMMWGF